MSIPARKYHTYQTHYLLADVAFNTPGISAGVQIGSLPAGAMVVGTQVVVDTAFDAETTNDLTVGTTPTGTDIVTAGTAAAGTAGAKESSAGNALNLAADTPVYVRYSQSGAAATAGKARIGIQFLVPATP